MNLHLPCRRVHLRLMMLSLAAVKLLFESIIGDIWESVFNEIESDICILYPKNPSADLYMPPSTSARGDISLSYLVAHVA